jgi:hypothetical protein
MTSQLEALRVAREALEAVQAIADESKGIAGWHQNGDIATWDELLPEVPHALEVLSQLSAQSEAPAEDDPVALWARIHHLEAEVKGPDGFATWKDAAIAERIRRVKAEAPVVPDPIDALCSAMDDAGLTPEQRAHLGNHFMMYWKKMLAAAPSAQPVKQDGDGMYFLQDKRSYVGNCPMWWAKDGKGYTTRIDMAHRYTKEQAFAQHGIRDTDVPWPCSVVEPFLRPTIDIQDLHKTDYFKENLSPNRRAAPSQQGADKQGEAT